MIAKRRFSAEDAQAYLCGWDGWDAIESADKLWMKYYRSGRLERKMGRPWTVLSIEWCRERAGRP